LAAAVDFAVLTELAIIDSPLAAKMRFQTKDMIRCRKKRRFGGLSTLYLPFADVGLGVIIRRCALSASCLVCPSNADIGSAFHHDWSYHAW
jgi:hypothetical protein